jgi:hypothetical protein
MPYIQSRDDTRLFYADAGTALRLRNATAQARGGGSLTRKLTVISIRTVELAKIDGWCYEITTLGASRLNNASCRTTRYQ